MHGLFRYRYIPILQRYIFLLTYTLFVRAVINEEDCILSSATRASLLLGNLEAPVCVVVVNVHPYLFV